MWPRFALTFVEAPPESVIVDFFQVCVIYETIDSMSPKVYLLEIQANKWQFLADTFTEYLRMCIAHLGLPYWELCFATTCTLPSWVEQLFLLLAPHLLERNEPRRSHILPNMATDQQSYPAFQPAYNQIDPSIFRIKTKCIRQTQKFK